jgi:hypothetical protein
MTRVLHWRGAAWLLACTLVAVMATTLLSTQRAEAESIHDVVSQTWPAPLVPTAEQIAYHEGHGIVTDGYCGWGLLPSTQAELGMSYGMTDDPYYCSAKAYELYTMYGWSPWTTYGMYTPGAGQTPITYY